MNLELCDGCKGDGNLCVQFCPLELWEPAGDKVKFLGNDLCIACRFCEAECPTRAIKVVYED